MKQVLNNAKKSKGIEKKKIPPLGYYRISLEDSKYILN